MPRKQKELTAKIKLELDQASRQKVEREAEAVGKKLGDASEKGVQRLDKSLDDIAKSLSDVSKNLSEVTTKLDGFPGKFFGQLADEAKKANVQVKELHRSQKEVTSGGGKGVTWPKQAIPNPDIAIQRTSDSFTSITANAKSLGREMSNIFVAMSKLKLGGEGSAKSLAELSKLVKQLDTLLAQSINPIDLANQKFIQLTTSIQSGKMQIKDYIKEAADLKNRISSVSKLSGPDAEIAASRYDAQLKQLERSAKRVYGKTIIQLTEQLTAEQNKMATAGERVAEVERLKAAAIKANVPPMEALKIAEQELLKARRELMAAGKDIAPVQSKLSEIRGQLTAEKAREAAAAQKQLASASELVARKEKEKMAAVAAGVSRLEAEKIQLQDLIRLRKQYIMAGKEVGPLQQEISRLQASTASPKDRGGFTLFGEKFNPAHVAMWAAQWHLVYGAMRLVENSISSIVQETVAFDKAMRHVNTISRLNAEEFVAMKRALSGMSGSYTTGFAAPSEIAKGLYFIESAGIKDSAEALTVLARSTELATGTQSGLEDATKGVIGLMNIYGKETMSAQRAADLLFATIDVATPEMKEFAGAQADLMVAAELSKVKFEELGGAFAALTRVGFSAQRSSTAIKNIIMTMVKPSEQLENTILGLGYASGQAMLQELGLKDTLMRLYDSVGRNKDEFARLMQNVRAAGGVLGLSTDNFKLLEESINGVTEASSKSGAAARSSAEQMREIGSGVKEFGMAVKTSLMDEFGPIYQLLSFTSTQLGKWGREINVGRLHDEILRSPDKAKSKAMGVSLADWSVAMELRNLYGYGGVNDKLFSLGAGGNKGILKAGSILKDIAEKKNPTLYPDLLLQINQALYGKDEGKTKTVSALGLYSDEELERRLGKPAPFSSEVDRNESWKFNVDKMAEKIRRKVDEEIRIAQEKSRLNPSKSEEYASGVVSLIDKVVDDLLRMGTGTGEDISYYRIVNGKKVWSKAPNPVASLQALSDKWAPSSTKGARSADQLETQGERYRDLRTSISDTWQDLQEKLNPTIDNVAASWKTYGNQIKAIEIEHEGLVTSFDATGEAMQKSVAQYLASAEKLAKAEEQKKAFEGQLSTAQDKRAKLAEESNSLISSIRLAETAVESGKKAGMSGDSLKKANDDLADQHNRLKKINTEVGEWDRKIDALTGHIEDLGNTISQLTQDKKLLGRFIADTTLQADTFTKSPFDQAMNQVAELTRVRNSITKMLTDKGDKASAAEIEKLYNYILESKRTAAWLEKSGKEFSFAATQASFQASPSWRDLLSGTGNLGTLMGNSQSQLRALTRKRGIYFSAMRNGMPKSEVDMALAEIDAQELSLYQSMLSAGFQQISTLADRNPARAEGKFNEFEGMFKGLFTQFPLLKKAFADMREDIFGEEAQFQRDLATIDDRIALDQTALFQKLERARQEFESSGNNEDRRRAAQQAIFGTASQIFSQAQSNANAYLEYMPKKMVAEEFLMGLSDITDEIGQSPNLQRDVAIALAEILGGKETTEQFLKEMKDQPFVGQFAEILQYALDNTPEIGTQLARSMKGAMDEIKDGFTDMFMSITREGESFEQSWNNLMLDLATSLYRNLISKMVGQGVDWLWTALTTNSGPSLGMGDFRVAGGFAEGGIVSTPGVYSLAERRQPEAVVPLPNGRSIPGQMMGAGKAQEIKSTTVVVFDRNQLAQLRTGKNEVVNYVIADLHSNGPIRKTIRKTVG
jgi:TP901 family phage tail tape measure protein